MSIDFKTDELIRTRTISAQIDGLSLECPASVEESVLMQGSPSAMKRSMSVLSANVWELCLEHAVQAIVSLKITEIKSFDTSNSGVYNASGFVVDKKNGIILTNRHVISSGPIVATATFNDYEEVSVQVLYIDPIHDYGFLKFDPADVRYMEVVQLELRPDQAKIGSEIRVCGNDNGEHLSIQHGILSRLDREAPPYGQGNYNDFNTFYLQACSGTSTGSSGSPVLNSKGKAVALNAGSATNGNQAFYFPLFCVQRALKLLCNGKKVPRGSLMCDFEYITFDNAKRLGLTQEVESKYRMFQGHRGILTINNVIPQGVADGHLENFDILVSLNGQLVDDFIALEQLLNENVDKQVELEILRDGETKRVALIVTDLHPMACPDQFVEFGDSIVHELSYHMARSFRMSTGGCFVSNIGILFRQADIHQKFVLTSFNGSETETVCKLVQALRQMKFDETVQFKYKFLDSDITMNGLLRLDLVDTARVFTIKDYKWQPEVIQLQKKWKEAVPLQNGKYFLQIQTGNGAVNDAARSMVYVKSTLSLMVDGCTKVSSCGVGVVVDAVKGVMVTTRSAVPSQLCNITLTFGNSCSTTGQLMFMHPMYNLVFVKYDPELVDASRLLRSAVLVQEVPFRLAKETYLVTLNSDGSRQFRKTHITDIGEPAHPLRGQPKFQPFNVEHMTLDNHDHDAIGGVMFNEHGQVQGLWCCDVVYAYGLPSVYMLYSHRIVNLEQSMRLLPAIVSAVPLSVVRQFGLRDMWMQRLAQQSAECHTVLQVSKSFHKSELLDGDVLLQVNGYLLTRSLDLELLQFALSKKQVDVLEITVLRDGQEVQVQVPTKKVTSSVEECQYVNWSGCVIQIAMPHVSEYSKVNNLPFISNVMVGSPAQTVCVPVGYYVQSIGDVRLSLDLEACFQQVAQLKGQQRVVLLSQSGNKKVVSVEPNDLFWPTQMLKTSKKGSVKVTFI